jgi:1-acyl-sn-glycerol-3-phosphate acyltransferase
LHGVYHITNCFCWGIVNINLFRYNPVVPNQLDILTRINLQDMLDNFGWSNLRRGRGIVERLFWSPARLLAHQVIDFDQHAGNVGLQTAARELLDKYVGEVRVIGAENVPATGGLILASNHPGMTDTLACFTALPRTDLFAVSADRPFLRTLPNIAQRMFWVSEKSSERMTVVRQVSRYVQSGGAVLICPAGQIEPDPASMPGAIESLNDWSESLGLFVRLAPDSVIVPTCVSGVIFAPALRNPLTRLRKKQEDRERLAATIQAAIQSAGWIKQRMRVTVEFGKPMRAADLIPLGDVASITRTVTDAMTRIIVQLERS